MIKIDSIRDTIRNCSEATEGIYAKLGESFPGLLSVTKNSGSSSLPGLKAFLNDLDRGFSAYSDGGAEFFSGWNTRNMDLFTVLGEKMASLDAINERVAQIRADSEELEIISLNAMVISIKSGEKGRAFSCITENLKKLSARMISLSNELLLDEQRLIEKNIAFKNSVKALLSGSSEASRTRSLDTVPELQESLGQAQSDLDRMSSEASRVQSPIHEAMSGIQLQDIIRQSIDQILLALAEMSAHSASGTDEDALDCLTLNIELIEICLRIADDVQKNLDASLAIFSANWDAVHKILTSVEALRKSFLSRYLDPHGSSGKSLPVLLDRMTSGFSDYIGQISLYQRGQKAMVRDSAFILSEVKHLRTLFDTIRPIISRLQHVRITQQIEVAKNPAISAVKDTVDYMSDLIMKADIRVQETRNELEAFIAEIEEVTREFGTTAAADQTELERIKQERTEFFHRMKDSQGALASSVMDLRVFPDSFQSLCAEIESLFATFRGTKDSFKNASSALKAVSIELHATRNAIFSQKGISSWQIHDSRLRDLVTRFTITSHKQAAGEIGGFEVEQSDLGIFESGEVTLF